MKLIPALAALSLSLSVAIAAPTRIGVLLKDRDLFWSAAEKGALAAAKDAGVEVIVKAPVVPNNLSQQKALLDALMKEPLQALVIAPLAGDAFKPQIAALAAKGVKIVALDTPLAEGAATFLGYNQETMAQDAARFFLSLLTETDAIAMMRANSIEGMSVREKTLLSVIKAQHSKGTFYSDVFAGAERQDDFAKSNLLLEKHADIRAVITPFSASTVAMTRAIQGRGLAGKVLHVGFGSGLPADIITAVEKGALQGWVAQQPYLIGRKGVEAALQLTEGKNVPATIDVPYTIVTKDNVQDPAIRALAQ